MSPVIAQVHGACLGGAAALALASDLLIAAADARLGPPGLRALAPAALAIAPGGHRRSTVVPAQPQRVGDDNNGRGTDGFWNPPGICL